MSSDHCKVVGKSMRRVPFMDIIVLGSTLIFIAPVVLVKGILKVIIQFLKLSWDKETTEPEEPADYERSIPILAIKLPVVLAGAGLIMFDNLMITLLIGVTTWIASAISTVLGATSTNWPVTTST